MTHGNTFKVWPECLDHTSPDDLDMYFCLAGNQSCLGLPLATFEPGTKWAPAYVLCSTCTAFVKAQDEYDDTHEWGEDVNGGDIVLCMAKEPELYCYECSDESGEWVKHDD